MIHREEVNGRMGEKERKRRNVCVYSVRMSMRVCMFTNVRVHKKVAEKSENVQSLVLRERSARERHRDTNPPLVTFEGAENCN